MHFGVGSKCSLGLIKNERCAFINKYDIKTLPIDGLRHFILYGIKARIIENKNDFWE